MNGKEQQMPPMANPLGMNNEPVENPPVENPPDEAALIEEQRLKASQQKITELAEQNKTLVQQMDELKQQINTMKPAPSPEPAEEDEEDIKTFIAEGVRKWNEGDEKVDLGGLLAESVVKGMNLTLKKVEQAQLEQKMKDKFIQESPGFIEAVKTGEIDRVAREYPHLVGGNAMTAWQVLQNLKKEAELNQLRAAMETATKTSRSQGYRQGIEETKGISAGATVAGEVPIDKGASAPRPNGKPASKEELMQNQLDALRKYKDSSGDLF